jgi:prepilin signal peptidase PulO-like enzyme (type II secretory pathway)
MLLTLFIFVFGLIFGSFLNAWEYRLERKMTLGGRSVCPKCKKKIFWYDNIPLISWILLRGKCRHCHKTISVQYPIVELSMGLVCLGLWHYAYPGIELRKWFDNSIGSGINNTLNHGGLPVLWLLAFLLLVAIFLLLALIAIYDAKTKYVLSKYAYLAAGLGMIYKFTRFEGSVTSTGVYSYVYPIALAAIIPAGIYWLMAKLSKERIMGYGDAEVALAIGFLLGWPVIIPAYYIAFIAGAIYGIIVLIKRKGGLKYEMPLGPFMVAGAFFAFIYGAQIINWYLNIISGI